jgi:tRNA uridine 5-carboxymethylaminomethyl modification enzyme
LFELLVRPHVRLDDLIAPDGIPESVREEVEMRGKYAGYLVQGAREIERLARLDEMLVPESLDYSALSGLSFEGRHLLARVRPRSFGQATRVPGVSQADLAMLAIYIKRGTPSARSAGGSSPCPSTRP